MSTSTNSVEIQESIYEDPDALLPDDRHEDHPEVKAKPEPAPRFKLYQQTQDISTSNNAESSYVNGSITTAESSRRSSVGYKRPVHPPPSPPVKTEKCTNVTEESSQPLNAQPPVKPPDIHVKPPPPPPPLPLPRPAHFPGSSKYSDTLPSSASQRHENTSAHPGQSRPSSAIYTYLTPVSLAQSQESPNVPGTNYGTQKSSPPLPPSLPPPLPPSLPPPLPPPLPPSLPPSLPPPPPPLQSSHRLSTDSETGRYYLKILPDNPDDTEVNELLNWFNQMLSYSSSMPLSLYGLSKEDTISSICQKAMDATKAWNLYNLLMMKRKENLQKIITDFRSICEQLNKKTIGIAGGTTGPVGRMATTLGIDLAPVTHVTSMIATAVSSGINSFVSGMGAHAAIASNTTVTRTAVEKLVRDYKEGVTDLERCLDFILSTAMELQRHGIARLESAGAHPDAVRMAYKLHNVLSSMDIHGGAHARSGGMTSEKLLQAFTKEMDLFFKENYGQKLKKSTKSIFSGKVSLLADALKEGLDHLSEIWEKLS